MDHLDAKRLSFVIYLVLRMHQFQKYHLLRAYCPDIYTVPDLVEIGVLQVLLVLDDF